MVMGDLEYLRMKLYFIMSISQTERYNYKAWWTLSPHPKKEDQFKIGTQFKVGIVRRVVESHLFYTFVEASPFTAR